MAGVNIDDFGASYVHYMPKVTQTLNNTSHARLLAKGKLKWEGKYLEKHVHVRRNVALAGVADGGAVPSAGKQSYTQAQVSRKFIVGAVQVTDGILDNASGTKHAAISVLQSELRGLLDTIRKWENYWFTRDGTGVVTLLGATATGTAITVDDARMLWEGAWYDILDSGDETTVHGTFQVTKINRALNAAGEAVLTVTPTQTGGVDGDYIVWKGSTSTMTNSYGKIPMGLDGMIDDSSGTFQQVNTTTYNRYTSPVLTNTTDRPLRPELFRQACSAIRQESGEKPRSDMYALMTYWQANQFEEMYEGQLRLQPNTKIAGLKVASFQSTAGNISVVPDSDTIYKKIFLMDPTEITRAVQHELEWRKNKSGGVFTLDQGNLRWNASCLETCEFMIDQRNRNAVIEALEEPRVTALG